MASSSSTSSIHKINFKYDVFLSFRGEDTRTNFVDHLYHALKQENIETYKDDKNLEKGKQISKELIQAIEESRFHVIVFSKSYASSSWCLDELVKIMECQKKQIGRPVYPIFYHVEPTQVRKQSGEFGKAFAKHENDEAAEKWREALVEATSFSGRDLSTTADGHEVEFIKLVVKDISSKLPAVSADGNLIGMRTRINGVVSYLNAFPNELCMLGIWGMGGGGKTTLARAVFDQISFQFEGKSFVANVREVSKPDFSGLNKLQQQVLRDVSNDQGIKVNNVFDGKTMMRKKMPGRKVLVVLDDVDHIDQLKALAGEPNWFKPGSKIIVTTRDKQVLLAHKVDSIHDVNLLTDEEAICLLSRCAFGTEIPSRGYEELSRKVVSYAAGLPLTITILGSLLCDAKKNVWIDTLERLEEIPLKETLQKLELSYMGLDADCKEIFLDVACLLKGWKEDEAIRALESCGFHAIHGLDVLEKRSLITISKDIYGDQCLDMHDHIEEMGKNIVRRLHPNEPYKHSRLWIDEEIEDILANNQGTEATTCIRLVPSKVLNPEIVMKGLGNMKNLRHLHVDFYSDDSDWKFDEVSEYFPNALRYLRWKNYPFGSLPKTFQASNLVAVHMDESRIVQLWEGGERKVFKKLRFLIFEFSDLKSLDLGLTPNLQYLVLERCDDLEELNINRDECLLKLRSLNINSFKSRTLDLRGTPNLETLCLTRCGDLEELNINPAECCLKLRSIYINSSKLRTLDLRGTPNLEKLELMYCYDLEEVNINRDECLLKLRSININSYKLRIIDLRGTPNLETLSLEGCHDLEELNINRDECLLKLRSININYSSSKLRTLDLRGTPNLETLSLEGCDDLEELNSNRDECLLKLRSINISYSKLRTLDLRGTPNLETLSLERCDDLEELNINRDECLLKLTSLNINSSKLRTLDLRGTLNLETLSLEGCGYLEELNINRDECLLKLRSINISYSKLRTLDLRGTPNLETLSLEGCGYLEELNINRDECLLKLRSINISCSKLRTLDLRGTPNLKTLSLEGCGYLEELNINRDECLLKLRSININYSSSKLRTLDLRGTPNLETLSLEGCDDLEELNINRDECLLKLRSINISYSKLRTLDLRGTPNLETLSLERCDDLEELNINRDECLLKLTSLNINSSKLRTLDLRGTLNLETLSLEGCGYLEELNINRDECLLKLRSLEIVSSKLRTLDLRGTPNLETLSLKGCEDLEELNINRDECLLKLRSLEIVSSKLRTLDLRGTPNLEKLKLMYCDDLQDLNINRDECLLKLGSLNINSSKLRTLDLRGTPNLKNLSLRQCYHLVEAHVPDGCLKKLDYIDLSDCLRFKSFSFKRQYFESVEVGNVSKLHLIAESLDMCPLHFGNNLPKFQFICLYEEHGPSVIGNLEKLLSFGLCACTNLERFSQSICGLRCLTKLTLQGSIREAPKDLHRLECLEELSLLSTEITHLPDSICLLKHLKSLELNPCSLLEKLPEDLGRLECLEMLILSNCVFLHKIPDSICKMKRLRYFHLRYCVAVEKLPEELGRLECLKELNIEGTNIRHLPQSIFELQGLRIVGFRWLLESCGFRSEIQTSEDETFCYVEL